jgi:hypothetical protein
VGLSRTDQLPTCFRNNEKERQSTRRERARATWGTHRSFRADASEAWGTGASPLSLPTILFRLISIMLSPLSAESYMGEQTRLKGDLDCLWTGKAVNMQGAQEDCHCLAQIAIIPSVPSRHLLALSKDERPEVQHGHKLYLRGHRLHIRQSSILIAVDRALIIRIPFCFKAIAGRASEKITTQR